MLDTINRRSVCFDGGEVNRPAILSEDLQPHNRSLPPFTLCRI